MTVRALRRGTVSGRGVALPSTDISVVQYASGTTGSVDTPASITPAFTASSVTGNLVLLIVGSDGTVETPTNWTLDCSQINSDGHYMFHRYSTGETTFPAVPVISTAVWGLLEIAGTQGVLDQVVSAGSDIEGSAPFNTGTTPTLTSSNEICVASHVSHLAGGAATWGSYTNSYVNPGINQVTTAATRPNVGLAVAVRVVSATTAQTTTATPSVACAATAMIGTYAGGNPNITAPSAPTGVSATAGNAQATISWTPPSNGGSPIDQYRVTSTPVTTTQTAAPPSTSLNFTGLTNDTSYTFKVAAHNSIGWGPDSVASNAVTPAVVQLRAIDGGTSFYSTYPSSLSDSPSYFPIAVWYESTTQQSEIDLDKGCGLNTYVVLTTDSNLTLITSNGMRSIVQAGDWNYTWQTGMNGWFLYDEVDMQLGPGAGYTECQNIVNQINDGHIRVNNYGKGVLFWESDSQAAQFVNNYQQIISADGYFFTDPDIYQGAQGGQYYSGVDLTYTQTRLAYNYGLNVNRLRGLVSPTASKIIWGFVEVGYPFTQTEAENGRQILPAECQAAVWHCIIRGARGIIYFNHSFGGQYITQHCLRDPDYAPVRAAVTTTNSQITTLAPVLNSPFADTYASTTSNIILMAKYYNGTFYIFAGNKVNASTPATIQVASGTTATVLYESRSITITGGQFSDTFADGNAIHIYQIS